MKTKFNIGDEVWFIRGDRPRSSAIKSIYITDKEDIVYNTTNWTHLDESEVFKTAKQAIESLYDKLDKKENKKQEEQMICD